MRNLFTSEDKLDDDLVTDSDARDNVTTDDTVTIDDSDDSPPPAEADTPALASADTISPSTSMPEPVTSPLIVELPDKEPPDDELPDADLPDNERPDEESPAEESPQLFTVSEESPQPQRKTRYSRSIGRRKPAPMPEALVAIHSRATAPAPIPSGRVSRDRSPITGGPPATPPPYLIMVHLISVRPLEPLRLKLPL